MRVAIVTESFYPQVNGVTNTVRHTVDGLLETGHHAIVIAPGPGPTSYRSVQVVRVRHVGLPGYQSFSLGLPDAAVERALAAFREAARIKPDYEEAYYNEGVALMALSRPAEAARAYREGLRLDPSNTDGWVNLGFAELTLRHTPEGLRAYETALSQRRDDPLALHGAAVARAVLGDSAGALRYLVRLESLDPRRAADLRRDLGLPAANPGR